MRAGTSRMRPRYRKLLVFIAALVALSAFVASGTVSASASSATATTFPVSNSELPLSPGCRFVTSTVPGSVLDHQVVGLPVSTLGEPANFTISGRLCMPASGIPKTVMLALHGITYTSQYWDVGYQPDTYSFVRHAMKAGYAVYAIDRLGYGLSSHPLGALVTVDAQAAVVHDIIEQLRAGKIGGQVFPYIILVGHSLGTAISWLESAQYNDANAVVGAGWASDLQTVPLARFFSGLIPAQLDPKTGPQANLDPTYFTSAPGQRDQNFLYDLSNVDPNVINYDQNVLRNTVTVGEAASFYNRFSDIPLGTDFPTTSQELKIPLPTSVTQNIHIPVFLDNGENDLFFCGTNQGSCDSSQALQLKEAPYFSAAACERAAVTPHAGHDLNLQLNAPFTYKDIITWANQVLGPGGTSYSQYKAICSSFSGTNGSSGPGIFGDIPESS